MALSDAELERLAELATLTLPSGSEREALRRQLGEIIDYVGAVREVGTSSAEADDTEPVRLRPDVPGPAGDLAWLEQSPLHEGPFVKVPGLFGNE